MRSPRLFLLLLFVAGVLVRLGLVLVLRDITAMPKGEPTADDIEFNNLALHVARGEGFINAAGNATSFRAPGWPLFLAGLYKLFGEHAVVGYVSMCVLGGVSCVLAYLIARRLMDERVARIAGMLCVVFLPHAYFCVMFWSESLFVPLFAASVWVLIIGMGVVRQASGTKTVPLKVLPLLAIAGLLLGAAALTRPFALLAGPLFALVLLTLDRPKGFVLACVLAAGVILVVAPWTFRNWMVHQKFVPIATNGGSTFYGSNNDKVMTQWRLYGSWVSTVELPGREMALKTPDGTRRDEVSRDKIEWQLGWSWVYENPLGATLSIPLKILRLILWLPDFDAGGKLYYAIRAAGWLPVLALIALGLWRHCEGINTLQWWILHCSLLATVLAAVIFWGSPRFRDANAPLLMVYAALAFHKGVQASGAASARRA